MKDTTQFKLKEHDFELRHWDPELGLRMLTRLIKICGEPVARALINMGQSEGKEKKDKKVSSLMDTDMNDQAKMAMISAGIGALADRLQEDEVVKFVKDAMNEAYCDGQPLSGTYKAVFLGRPGMMFKVLQKQVAHQLSDFLEFLPVTALK